MIEYFIRLNKIFIIFCVFVITSFLIACSSSNSSNSNSTSSAINLGVLANGSVVYVSSANFSVTHKNLVTTGIIGVKNGMPGYSGTLLLNITPLTRKNTNALNLPSISTDPKICRLVAGSYTSANCKIMLSANSDVPDGTYNIVPVFIPTSGEAITLNPFSLTVSSDDPSIAGNLSITIMQSNLHVGESSFANIILSNSANIHDLSIDVKSTNQNVITLNQNNCILSSANNICKVVINALESGYANINISALGYPKITSNLITVNSAIVVGELVLHLDHSSIGYNESTNITASLIGSSGVRDLMVHLTSDNESIVTLSQHTCVLSSEHTSCNVVASAFSESGLVQITESAIGYDNSSVNLNVIPSANLYFATTDGLVYSNDSLLSGTAPLIPDGGSINTIKAQDGIYYIGTSNGDVFIESRGIWCQVGGGPAIDNGKISSIAIDGKNIYVGGYSKTFNAGVVYVESGNGWQMVGESFAIPNGYVTSIAIESNILYAGGATISPNSGVVYMESGNGWQMLNNYPVMLHGYVLSIAVNRGTVYAGGRNLDFGTGVVYLNSHGIWQRVARAATIKNGEIYSVLVNQDRVYASGRDLDTGSGVVYFESGVGWELMGNPPIANGEVYSIVLDHGTLYAAGVDMASRSGVVYMESNNNWQLVGESNPVANGQVFSLAINLGRIYVGSDHGVVESFNDNKWSYTVAKSLNSSSINALVLDNNESLYAGTSDGFVYVRSGDSWQAVGSSAVIPNGEIYAMAVGEDNKLYVAGINKNLNAGVVYVKSGANWELVGDQSVIEYGQINALIIAHGVIYAGGYDWYDNSGVVYAKSGNDSWKLVNESSVITSGEITSVAFYNNKLYVGGYDADLQAGVVYVNSNNEWKIIGDGDGIFSGYVKSIAINANKIYAGGLDYDFVHKTRSAVVYEDSGTGWVPVDKIKLNGSIVNSLVIDVNGDVYAATDMNRIFYLKSGMKSWTELVYKSYYSNASLNAMLLR